jgi:hypothetical protein
MKSAEEGLSRCRSPPGPALQPLRPEGVDSNLSGWRPPLLAKSAFPPRSALSSVNGMSSRDQKNPALKSKPYVAKRSHTNSPTPQNIAIDLSVSISTRVPATRESTFAIAVIRDLSKATPSLGLFVKAIGSNKSGGLRLACIGKDGTIRA